MRKRRHWIAALFCCLLSVPVFAAIETADLEKPWAKQSTRDYEVGRYPVRWRHKLDKKAGLFTGVVFAAPADRQTVWKLATDYSDVGKVTPGVQAVRIHQEGANRQVIETDLKVLWKSATLRFEIEQEPPNAVRFHWQDPRLGEITGVALFSEQSPEKGKVGSSTRVEMAIRFHAYRAVPLRLLLGFQRMAMLSAVRNFLESCEARGYI